MAGRIVLAAYRPREGAEAALRELLRRHVPTLRTRGLATDRPVLLLRAEDGTHVEVFEWVDDAASAAAHQDAAVQAIWQSLGEVADFVAPSSVPGLERPFPHLEPVDGVVA